MKTCTTNKLFAFALSAIVSVGVPAEGASESASTACATIRWAGQLPLPHHDSIEAGPAVFRSRLNFVLRFNHKEAIRSFQGALKHDPDCAMAQWGTSLRFGPARKQADVQRRERHGLAGSGKIARAQVEGKPKEQAYIDAMASVINENTRKTVPPSIKLTPRPCGRS
jgi:hypothetical protein